LRARNADRDGRIDLPLLLIDDEADNASINTRQNPDETTAINQAIRDLLGLFRRSSYVGFTATPFANIFIDPSSRGGRLRLDSFSLLISGRSAGCRCDVPYSGWHVGRA